MPYTRRRRYPARRIYKRKPAAIARRKVAYRTRRKFRRIPFRKMVPGGFGRVKFCKLKYCEEITINAAVASVATHVFRTNSLYDPNSTGVGHQPMGFDEWALRYGRYVVLSSTCYMRYINPTTENAVPCFFCVAQTATGTVYSGLATTRLLENPHHSKVKVAGDADVANENRDHTVRTTWNARKWFRKNPMVENDYGAAITANPAEMCYFECCCAAISGNDPAGQNFLVTIYYNCAFFDPFDLGQS